VPDNDGPIHRYLGASPGCWAAYGELSEREASDYRYMRHHQMTVDSTRERPRRRRLGRSPCTWSASTCSLSASRPPKGSTPPANASRPWARGGELNLAWLEPPVSPGEVTVLHMLGAGDPEEYGERALEWAKAVWEAWSDHHETVRRWAGV